MYVPVSPTEHWFGKRSRPNRRKAITGKSYNTAHMHIYASSEWFDSVEFLYNQRITKHTYHVIYRLHLRLLFLVIQNQGLAVCIRTSLHILCISLYASAHYHGNNLWCFNGYRCYRIAADNYTVHNSKKRLCQLTHLLQVFRCQERTLIRTRFDLNQDIIV